MKKSLADMFYLPVIFFYPIQGFSKLPAMETLSLKKQP